MFTNPFRSNSNLSLDKALSPLDSTHVVLVNGVWELPFGPGKAMLKSANKWVGAVAGGWIIDPLGLRNTAFEPDADLIKKVATGYEVRQGQADSTVPTGELHAGRGYKVPNGALFTTVGDLARWVSFELGHGPSVVLEKERIADNLSRVYASDGGLHGGFGIGFQLLRKGELVVAGHGGSVAGFIAGAYFHQASDSGLVYLRNLGQGVRNDLVLEAFEALTTV